MKGNEGNFGPNKPPLESDADESDIGEGVDDMNDHDSESKSDSDG